MSVRLLVGDTRQILPTLPDASVQCVVTSPPYFGLRDYGVSGQIGLERTPAEYVEQMVAVFREVRRALRDDGVVFLNLGDSYFGGGGGGGSKGSKQQTNAGSLIPGHTRAGAQRAVSYGKHDRELEGSRDRGCLCGSLCDACRVAYRLGKVHSDRLRAPKPSASRQRSNRAHIGLQCDRLPMSGLSRQGGRNEDATRYRQPSECHAPAQPPCAPESTPDECAPPHQAECLPMPNHGGCQLCGRSLAGCAQASADMTDCSCDTDLPSDALNQDRLDSVSSGLAYQYYTTTFRPKPKDLLGIPWRVAFALQADGWWLRSDIIWAKPNPMPESVTDRPTSAHEHVFLLTKRERYFYDAEAVREPATSDRPDMRLKGVRTGQAYLQKGPLPDNTTAARERAIRSAELDTSAVDATDRNCRNVWTIATSPYPNAHFATFPPELAERCIKAGSRPGDTVLDPFGGAGTTGLVADRLGRAALLIELNPAYAKLAENRIRDDMPLFADVA